MAVKTLKRVVIHKNTAGQGTRGGWSNTYHIQLDNDLTDPIWDAAALHLAQIEAGYHGQRIFFDRAVTSTVAPKALAGAPDKPRVTDLKFNGYRAETLEANGLSHRLPTIAVLEVNFNASLILGRHTYRGCILSQDWEASSNGAVLLQPLRDIVNNLWQIYFEQFQGLYPLVNISNTPDGSPAYGMTSIKCGSIAYRQLEQKRRKKKGFDVKEADAEETAEEELAQAVEVIQEISARRYTPGGGALLASAAFAGALSSLIGAGVLLRSAREAGDYGPNPVVANGGP